MFSASSQRLRNISAFQIRRGNFRYCPLLLLPCHLWILCIIFSFYKFLFNYEKNYENIYFLFCFIYLFFACFACMYAWVLYVYIHVWCQWKPENGIWSPEVRLQTSVCIQVSAENWTKDLLRRGSCSWPWSRLFGSLFRQFNEMVQRSSNKFWVLLWKQKKLNAILPQQLINISFQNWPKTCKTGKTYSVLLVSWLSHFLLFISSTIGVMVNRQLQLTEFQILEDTTPILSGLFVSISGADFLSMEDSAGTAPWASNPQRTKWKGENEQITCFSRSLLPETSCHELIC